MKFEKINKDKIKVTLNRDDLTANDIDFHSFMSNSEETHSLFLDVLEKAEKDYDFSTKDYSLKVETVALANGNFILTITRVLEPALKPYETEVPRKKLKVSRKTPKDITSSAVYKFNSFEDFCDLANSLYTSRLIDYKLIAQDSILYSYKENYYLVLSKINISFEHLKSLFALVTEFGTYVDSTDVFIAKLSESGSIIFKNNAIENCIKHFIAK